MEVRPSVLPHTTQLSAALLLLLLFIRLSSSSNLQVSYDSSVTPASSPPAPSSAPLYHNSISSFYTSIFTSICCLPASSFFSPRSVPKMTCSPPLLLQLFLFLQHHILHILCPHLHLHFSSSFFFSSTTCYFLLTPKLTHFLLCDMLDSSVL